MTLDTDVFRKAIYLELKAADVEEMRRRIVSSGVKVLEIKDPHLYFQALADKSSGSSEPMRTWPSTRGRPTTVSCPAMSASKAD